MLGVAMAALLIGGALCATPASACTQGDGGRHIETNLSLSADATAVAAGQPVTLTGTLTAEAASDNNGDDGDGCGWGDRGGWGWNDSARRTTSSFACFDRGDRDSEETGSPIADATLVIYQSADGVFWSELTTVATGPDGSYVVTPTVSANTTFVAEFEGDGTYEGADSCMVPVAVFASVGVPVPTSRTVGGKVFVVRGRATRGAGRITVTVYKRGLNNRLVKVRSAVAAFSKGVYTARLKLGVGSYVARAAQASGVRIHGASSKYRVLAVRRR
jgi:hypothetical protein